jgi:hypothetical protein
MTVRANNLKVYPGTDLTKEYIKKGIIDERYDWRKSSWHTPQANTLTYKQIRVLKNVLRAIGEAAEEYDIALFKDDLDTIKEKLGNKKHQLDYNNNEITITGHMFRTSPYEMMAKLLLIRFGAFGAASMEVSKSEVKAIASDVPEDEVQSALYTAFHGKEIVKKQYSLM